LGLPISPVADGDDAQKSFAPLALEEESADN
jgi:hypothetical protein